VVLGMHRSGTSAVTHALSLLGLSVGNRSGLKLPSDHNERGFWEQAALSDFNEALLNSLGGTWSAPPELEPGWASREPIASRRAEALAVFRETLPAEGWVWKDPRNCIALPFWLETLGIEPVTLIIHRHPAEIWRSLDARDGFSRATALSLWERYMRSALTVAAGGPALVVRYAEVLAEPREFASEARQFLDEAGVSVGAGSGPVEAFADLALRHNAAEDQGTLAGASEEQRALFEAMEGLVGRHEKLAPGDLPAETPWTEPLLAERRRADLVIEPLRLRSKRLDVDLRVARRRVDRLRGRIADRDRTIASRDESLAASRAKTSRIERSLSWRLTSPLRRIASLLRRRG
jgi:hypothetical protein